MNINNIKKPKTSGSRRLFGGGGVLGDGLGALGDGVLGQLAGEDEPHGGLDFARGDGGLLVVGGELGGLGGDALEDVWMWLSELADRIGWDESEERAYR